MKELTLTLSILLLFLRVKLLISLIKSNWMILNQLVLRKYQILVLF